ncbi:MAG: hypothetical protein ACRCSN_14140 [Dermatophilaceae bacterium]
MHRRMPPAHLLLLLAGALLVAVGIVVVSALPSGGEVEFGWFAYAPSPDGDWPIVVLFPRQVLGAAGTAVGAVLVAGVLGYRLGLRRTTTGT